MHMHCIYIILRKKETTAKSGIYYHINFNWTVYKGCSEEVGLFKGIYTTAIEIFYN